MSESPGDDHPTQSQPTTASLSLGVLLSSRASSRLQVRGPSEFSFNFAEALKTGDDSESDSDMILPLRLTGTESLRLGLRLRVSPSPRVTVGLGARPPRRRSAESEMGET